MITALDVLQSLVSGIGFICLFFGPSVAAFWLYKQVTRELLTHISRLERRIDKLEGWEDPESLTDDKP